MSWMIALLGLWGCAGGKADTIITGAQVHLGDGALATAVAFEQGRVLALGEEALASEGRNTAVIDGQGLHAYPGFTDAHTHLLAGSFVLDRLLLTGVSSMDTILDRVASYAELHPEEPWIVGYGWIAEAMLDEPQGVLLDAIVSDRPVLLANNSGHSALVNSYALQRAGITADTPDPPDGVIGRDPETGELTGYLLEGALSLISEVAMSDYSNEQIASGLDDAMDDFIASGLTGISEIMASPGFDISRPSIYQQREEAGELGLRIHIYVPIFSPTDVLNAATLRQEITGELVTFGGGKIWVDGSMGTGEAWSLEAHVDDPENFGSHYVDVTALIEAISLAEQEGLSLKLHANGDAAIEAALDAFEVVAEERGGLDQQHVLEHVVLITEGDRLRLAGLGLVASVQPVHVLPAGLGETADKWGERFDDAYDYASLAEAGVPLAFGTDWPVWPNSNPLLNLWSSQNMPQGHRVSRQQAIGAYTQGSALSQGRSDELGCLQVGCLADAVLFDGELAAVEIGDLMDIEVQQVWVAGRRVD